MYYAVIICIPILFYFVIPILGMIHSYHRQQKCISQIVASRYFPLCPDHFIADTYFKLPDSGTCVRFFGKIASWESPRTLILENQGLEVQVNLSQSSIMTLVPSPAKFNLATYKLRKLNLRDIGAVNLRTNIFVCGNVEKKETPQKQELLTFTDSVTTPLTVVLFEGDSGQFLSRLLMASAGISLDSGAIVPSLMTGFFSLLLTFTALLQQGVPQSYAITAGVCLLSIFLLFFPPGIIAVIPAKPLFERATEARRCAAFIENLLFGMTAPDELESASIALTAVTPLGRKYCAVCPCQETVPIMALPAEITLDGKSTWTSFSVQDVANSSIDPFYPSITVPGIPTEVIENCKKKSYRWNLLSGGFFFAGFVTNMYIFAKFLYWLM